MSKSVISPCTMLIGTRCNCHMKSCVFFCVVYIYNFLLKNVIVFFFFLWNQISKWRSFEKIKRLFLTYFSDFLVKDTKIPPAHNSHTYTYCAYPIDFFALYQFCKLRIYLHDRFLFGVAPGVFRAILKQSINNKMVSKIKVEMSTTAIIYYNAKFIVICKPRTLNDGRWRLSSVKKTQKSTAS